MSVGPARMFQKTRVCPGCGEQVEWDTAHQPEAWRHPATESRWCTPPDGTEPVMPDQRTTEGEHRLSVWMSLGDALEKLEKQKFMISEIMFVLKNRHPSYAYDRMHEQAHEAFRDLESDADWKWIRRQLEPALDALHRGEYAKDFQP